MQFNGIKFLRGNGVIINNKKQYSIFSGNLSQTSLAEIKKTSKETSFKKGKNIVFKGQMIGGVYIVKSGTLRVYTIDLNGNEKPIYSLQSGEICIFSINCIISQIAYPAWVTIDSDNADVLSIPAKSFRKLYENEPSIREYVFDSMSQRIFDLMSSIEEVTTHEIGYRINSFLVRSCPKNNTLSISHQDIATSLGTAREVVSRHLKHLEKAGCLKLSRKKIEIVSPKKLAEMHTKNPV